MCKTKDQKGKQRVKDKIKCKIYLCHGNTETSNVIIRVLIYIIYDIYCVRYKNKYYIVHQSRSGLCVDLHRSFNSRTEILHAILIRQDSFYDGAIKRFSDNISHKRELRGLNRLVSRLGIGDLSKK